MRTPEAEPSCGEISGSSGTKPRVLAVVALVVVLAASFGIARLVKPPQPASAQPAAGTIGVVKVGERAPEFASTTIAGEQVSLAGYRGKPVWLVFGASWCTGCRAEAPDIEAVWQESSARVQVVGINLGEDAQAVRAYANRLHTTYPQVPDPDSSICGSYGARAVPLHVFVDAEGVVRHVHAGIMTKEQMTQQVAAVSH